MMYSARQKRFLFLQGPAGPLFYKLGAELIAKGHAVVRINLSGGDRYDWPDEALNYVGDFADWPSYLDQVLKDYCITDMLLFGDCRPYHVSGHRIASSRSVDIHVLEEGYVRPHWMTLEPMGVNGNSSLPHDPKWFLEQARMLPPIGPVEPITASFGRRMRDTYWYYHHTFLGRLRFRHFRSHRPGSLLIDGIGWLTKFTRNRLFPAKAAQVLSNLKGKPYFLFPLQLSSDYQIRSHSAFADMPAAAHYVIESFARHAPPSCSLLIKAHPLDSSFFNWNRFVEQQARQFGLQERLMFVDGGDLNDLSADTQGMVCVNSTSATLALSNGKPVCALGDAVYNMMGITHQGHIDSFWTKPTPPDPKVYDAFHQVLLDRCLIHGGLASESAVSTLIESMVKRLIASTGRTQVADKLLGCKMTVE
jgi:capsular polysaccharide export protein